MMRRGLVCAALAGLQWLGGALALADAPPEPRAERQRIAAERAAVEADAARAEAECRTRFAVSGCVAEVQARRRAALAPLRERELVLDDAERKAASLERAQRLEAKRAEAASAPPTAASASVRTRAPVGAAQAGPRERKPSKTADDAAEAAQRAAERQQRLSDAAAHRQEVEQRNAERAARGKKSPPLPVPSAASVAAIASAPAP